MKKIKLILSLVVALIYNIASANPSPARLLAIDIVERAYSVAQAKGNYNFAGALQDIARVLRTSTILVVGSCPENQLGFTYSGQSNIYLCPTTTSQSTKFIAQVLIHESAHLAIPTTDECLTTATELAAMTYANESYFSNDYISQCRLPF